MQQGPSDLGTRIRKLRMQMGVTPTVLSEKAGISRSYLYQIEDGSSSPTQAKVQAIADALGVRVSELIGEPSSTRIPPELRELAAQEHLTEPEVEMLAQIQYRGKRPSTIVDWKTIYAVIKGTLGK